MKDNEPEVLIVNESSETVVNFEPTEKLPEPLIDHVADNDSNEVLIMEEEMAVDLSMTSNNTAGGKFLFCFFWSTGVVTQVYFLIIHHYCDNIFSLMSITNTMRQIYYSSPNIITGNYFSKIEKSRMMDFFKIFSIMH